MDRQGNGSLFFMGLCILYVWIVGCIAADDVPDNVVYTDLHKTVQREDSVVLKCQFRGTPLAVYWKKGDDPQTAPILITWFGDHPPTGSCVDNNSCDIDDEFSLIIKNITIKDEGQYICRVANYKGIVIHNFTDLEVIVPPREPYPIINECKEFSLSIGPEQTCTILTMNSTVNLTCSAFGFYPALEDLYFLHGSDNVPSIETAEQTNDDMTMNKYITIRASASDIPYVCILRHRQQDTVIRSATALVKLDTPFDNDDAPDVSVKKFGFIAIPVACISVLIAVAFLWRRRRQQQRMQELSKKKKSMERTSLIAMRASISRAGVNKGDNDVSTSLHIAARNGHLDVTKYLISQGGEVNKGDNDGRTALHWAALNGHLDVTKYLISQGGEVDKDNGNGETALHFATQNGHLDVTKYLISQGGEMNKGDNDGWTALHWAAQNGHLDVTKYLISQGGEVNKGDNDGWTALHWAALNGHLDVTKYLISKGGEVNKGDNDGFTALHSAAQNGHLDVTKYLISQGGEVSKGENDGWTALHSAAQNGLMALKISPVWELNKGNNKNED